MCIKVKMSVYIIEHQLLYFHFLTQREHHVSLHTAVKEKDIYTDLVECTIKTKNTFSK